MPGSWRLFVDGNLTTSLGPHETQIRLNHIHSRSQCRTQKRQELPSQVELTREGTQKHSSNPIWLEAINKTLSDRGHDRKLTTITKSLWDRHIEPLIAALEEGALATLRKRKRVGYQVIDPAAGEMPDGWVSFGIYSLADCRRVIKEDKDRWQLVTIFEGEIEEPTFM